MDCNVSGGGKAGPRGWSVRARGPGRGWESSSWWIRRERSYMFHLSAGYWWLIDSNHGRKVTEGVLYSGLAGGNGEAGAVAEWEGKSKGTGEGGPKGVGWFLVEQERALTQHPAWKPEVSWDLPGKSALPSLCHSSLKVLDTLALASPRWPQILSMHGTTSRQLQQN